MPARVWKPRPWLTCTWPWTTTWPLWPWPTRSTWPEPVQRKCPKSWRTCSVSRQQTCSAPPPEGACEPVEIGISGPGMTPVEQLGTGEVGYVATGLKNGRDCSVGDTITTAAEAAKEALPGYRPLQPV